MRNATLDPPSAKAPHLEFIEDEIIAAEAALRQMAVIVLRSATAILQSGHAVSLGDAMAMAKQAFLSLLADSELIAFSARLPCDSAVAPLLAKRFPDRVS